MKTYVLSLVVIVLALTACSPNESPASLIGSWRLTSYGPPDALSPAVEGAEAGITFNEDGTLAGNSGCNGYSGSYTVEGNQLTFTEIVSTLIFCDEPLGAQEEAVYQVLTETAIFEIEGNTLTISNNDRVIILER